MNLYPFSIFLLSINTWIAVGTSPSQFTGDVSINCGSSDTSATSDGREWHGDLQPKFYSFLHIKGSSTSSVAALKPASGDDSVPPYSTARLSRSQFSYGFRLSPGQKILRLHFNPRLYKGYERCKDLFAVDAGPFTLLSNFSASLTASALGVNSFVKEYCINIQENQLFSIVFSPASSQLFCTFAFINGIEIISLPASLSYFHEPDIGLPVVGKSPIYVDSRSALEIIRRLNLKQDSVSSAGDVGYMFEMWEAVPKQKPSEVKNITWTTSVDVGFSYLVRLYFSEMADFKVSINEMLVDTRERENEMYVDYMVMMRGREQEGKHDLVIWIESNAEFIDGHGPFKGFEIVKLSNLEYSLASPNPLMSSPQDSSYETLQNLHKVVGDKNRFAAITMLFLAAANIIIHTLNRTWDANATGAKEANLLLVRALQLCGRFSLAEIQAATKNFSEAYLIGKGGGFRKVYKGLIDEVEVDKLLKSTPAIEEDTLENKQSVDMQPIAAPAIQVDHNVKMLPIDVPAFPVAEINDTIDDFSSKCLIAKGQDAAIIKLNKELPDHEQNVDMQPSAALELPDHEQTVDMQPLAGLELPDHRQAIDMQPIAGLELSDHEQTVDMQPSAALELLDHEETVDMQPSAALEFPDEHMQPSAALELPNEQTVDTQTIAARELPDHEQTVDIQSIAAFEFPDHEQTVDMQPIAAVAIPVDHSVKMQPSDVPAFPVAEINDITNDFSSKCLIADGFRGSLFHGVLKSGHDAAILKLNKELPNHEFISEVSTVSRLKHENVVQLLGYCSDGGPQVLVYEFAPRGSLHDILHGRQGIAGLELEPAPALSWPQRIKIAVGVATGLCYIHDKALIHRNITSDNVLLFDDETAKITNLHPSSTQCSCKASYRKLSYRNKPDRDESHRDEPYPFTDIFLNRGYHPPECGWSDQTQKGDVYSVGLVLLHLLTGMELFDLPRRAGKEKHLLPWTKQHLTSDKVCQIVDARLEVDYPLKAVQKMAEVAQLCLQYKADMRPDMTTVLRALQIASQETQDYYLLKP